MDKGKLTLHKAMEIVLSECPNKTATFEYVSAEIARQKLYSQKLGGIAPRSQIRLRAKNYPNLFEIIPPDKVHLK